MPVVVLLALGLGLPASAQTTYEVTVDISPQLFAVLCAARAGGLIHTLGASGDPVAQQVEERLARLDPQVAEPLRAYFKEKYPNPNPRFLSTYISMALVLGPPPDWGWALPRDQLPPDVWDSQDFQPLLRASMSRRSWRGCGRRCARPTSACSKGCSRSSAGCFSARGPTCARRASSTSGGLTSSTWMPCFPPAW
jgi:hypothetical protein